MGALTTSMIGQHAWGTTILVEQTARRLIVSFRADRGGDSSTHRHLHHENTVLVLRGRVTVIQGDAWQTLFPGQSLTVERDAVHSLRFSRGAEGLEVYEAVGGAFANVHDIERIYPA